MHQFCQVFLCCIMVVQGRPAVVLTATRVLWLAKKAIRRHTLDFLLFLKQQERVPSPRDVFDHKLDILPSPGRRVPNGKGVNK